jgi:hypothetical protein
VLADTVNNEWMLFPNDLVISLDARLPGGLGDQPAAALRSAHRPGVWCLIGCCSPMVSPLGVVMN